MGDRNKFVIMDGNSIANRAFYALPPLNNASGIHTNAVYGFTTMLLKVLEEEKPTHILVAFDAGKVVFRHQDFKEYKGKRQKTPEELTEQFPLIKELLDAFSIPRLELEGYEADDIIGTLTRQAEEMKIQTLIVTGDKDMLQLVSDQVQVMLTRKGISEVDLYDRKAVRERYDLTPEQIIDLKGLMGDSSDNIPGIPGVGEKTALKLLHQFGSVEKVLENAEQVSGKKLKEKIEQNKEQALMSKQLATIMRDAPVDVTLDQLHYPGYDRNKVEDVFNKLEFKSLLERIGGETTEQKTRETEISFTIAEADNLDKLAEKLTSPMAIYVEIDGEYYHQAPVVGLAVSSIENGDIIYIPFERALEWEAFQNWLKDPDQKKWVYDVKRSLVGLQWHGIELNGIEFDTLIASYLLNPSESRHSLSDIAGRKTDFSLPSDEEVYGKGAKRKLPEGQPLAEHISRKARAVAECCRPLQKELEDNQLDKLFYDLELPLAAILGEMEVYGFKVDKDRLQQMGDELQQKLDQLTEEIYELAGTSFNINSPKQLGEILFEKLNLTPLKKTKTGYSTSADVLEKLADQHEIIPKILHFRQLGKLESTYIQGLIKVIHPETGKVHTIFNQAITATGRLSSTEPNLQNIPIRMEEGRKIRQAFIPSEQNMYILSADYSQIELRVLAHISEDPNLIEAFIEDMDIHTRTAMDVFGIGEDEVTSLLRRQAKAVNFGIVYGISDYGLSQNLNIPRKEAKAFIDRYFEVYQGVKSYMNEIVQKAKKDGYVTTLLHRRRYLPEINSRNFNQRSFAERTAMNTPIQGTAADIIKLAMVNVAERIRKEKLNSRMLLQVHDELVFEVPEAELEQLKQAVKEEMENAIELKVPLKVDMSFGNNWYEAK
ncbi:MAG: DNA polymerase I [Bacillaceae bacterium]|nr:DNA polymerase I [Bacillaceae bacterium]